MVSHFMAYLQFDLGAQRDATGRIVMDTSWSAQLQASEQLWMLLEGTHVITLMLFAGTILFVDLRLLGVAMRGTPVSQITKSLLPYTVAGFAIVVITGIGLFFANAFEYYHNVVFRVKIAFLFAAAINIFVFHYRVQADAGRWDTLAVPPLAARASAATSLVLWVAVIVAGRFVAYDWFSCDVPGALMAEVSQCGSRDATLAWLAPRLAA